MGGEILIQSLVKLLNVAWRIWGLKNQNPRKMATSVFLRNLVDEISEIYFWVFV